MQSIHHKIRSVLNLFQEVEGVVADLYRHDVGPRNAMVNRELRTVQSDYN